MRMREKHKTLLPFGNLLLSHPHAKIAKAVSDADLFTSRTYFELRLTKMI